jgi:hypothetical protein
MPFDEKLNMKIMKTPLFTLAAFLLFLMQLQAQESN